METSRQRCALSEYCQYRQTSPTCLGRNKSSIVTIAMDLALHGGGDYHTTYWPQASYLSSRKYYIGTAECCTEYSLCNKVLPRVHLLRLPGAGLQPGRPQHHLLALHRARAGRGRGGVRRVPHLHPHQTIAHGNCPGSVRMCLTQSHDAFCILCLTSLVNGKGTIIFGERAFRTRRKHF